jgi:uncharacterized delta-60 repeat protein
MIRGQVVKFAAFCARFCSQSSPVLSFLSPRFRSQNSKMHGSRQANLASNLMSSHFHVVFAKDCQVSVVVALLVFQVVRLHCQTLDSFNPAANDTVNSLVVQPDGKILVGGYFSMLGGQPRNRIGRLNPDGSLDVSFDPGTNFSAYTVSCLVLQPDGKILVGGDFGSVAGLASLVRILPDGSLDAGFRSGVGGPIQVVGDLTVQADDRILVGGYFSSIGGQGHTNLARLNPDGSVDSGFSPDPNLGVYTCAVQPNGGIIIGGAFNSLGAQPITNLARLYADGTVDTGFRPACDGQVNALSQQADTKLVLVGDFMTLGGLRMSDYGLGRINTDGSVDGSFNPGINSGPYSIALQSDGKILVAGDFTLIGGQPTGHLGRLNRDGTVDTSLSVSISTNSQISCVALQADGSILLGGWFWTLNGQSRQCIARLTNTGPSTHALAFDGSTIHWWRAGTGPEVWRATFEVSTNGNNWSVLGVGERVSGGWQLSGVVLSTNASIRARGFVQGGVHNGSAWFAEETMAVDPRTPPIIVVDGSSFGIVSNRFGFTVNRLLGQTVAVESTLDLKNWTPLVTNAIANGGFYFSEPVSAGSPGRFFRAGLR